MEYVKYLIIRKVVSQAREAVTKQLCDAKRGTKTSPWQSYNRSNGSKKFPSNVADSKGKGIATNKSSRRDKEVCFECGEPRHMAYQCPKRNTYKKKKSMSKEK